LIRSTPSAPFRLHPRPLLVPYTTPFRSLCRAQGTSAITSKPTDGDHPRLSCFYPASSPSGKPVLVRQLRGRTLAGEPRQACRKEDRKSTRLNSSHGSISYGVFCLTIQKE